MEVGELILRLENICKSYPRRDGQKVALDHVSLEVERGQIVGIFGPSGAGKTTLLRIAAGLEAPDGGIVSYKDERIDRISAAQLRRYQRREIGCVWAGKPWTPGLCVRDQVELPLLIDGCDSDVAARLARECLTACEAEQCIDLKLEDLSDGEHRRVAIAQALVIEPLLLVVDGAVSGLSLLEQESIMALLVALAHDEKVAVLVADTGASEIVRADPILYMRDGKLIGDDPQDKPGNVYTLPSNASHRPAADA